MEYLISKVKEGLVLAGFKEIEEKTSRTKKKYTTLKVVHDDLKLIKRKVSYTFNFVEDYVLIKTYNSLLSMKVEPVEKVVSFIVDLTKSDINVLIENYNSKLKLKESHNEST